MNDTLEKLTIKDVFADGFWKQDIECPKCSWRGKVYELITQEGKTKGTNVYYQKCPVCAKIVIDLSLSAWGKG